MLDAMDAVTAIQRRQLGLITVDQAVTAGLTYEQIRGLCQRGVWFAEREGVFAPAGAPPTAERAVLAAILAAGGPAWASHETAGWLWPLRRILQPDKIELLRPLGHHMRLQGVVGHRSGALFSADLTTIRRIPVTTPERTVVELSGRLPADELGRIVDDGIRRRLLTLDRLRRCTARLDTAPGRRLSVVRAVLAERLPGYDPGDSDLETRVLKTIVGAGLPPPIQQHRVRVRRKTYKLDLAYPHLLAGFELDSWKYHGQHSPFTDDRTRRNYLELVGWRIYQFTDSHSDAHIVDVVRSVLEVCAQSPAA
jgi:hypothetical protein